MTKHCKILNSKTTWIWSIMALQLTFAIIILSKRYNNKESGKIKVVKICSKASIIDIFCTEVWSGVLILATSVSVLTIFICLIRAYFPIFFHKAVSSKVKSIIIPRYIAVWKEALERSTFDKKLLSELLLSSTFYKQYWMYARLIHLRYFIISADFQW